MSGAAWEADRMLSRVYRSVLVVSALVLVAGACSSSGAGQAAAKTTRRTAASGVLTAKSTATPAAATKITHIFLIMLENEDFTSSWGPSSPAKYLNGTLRPKGALLTQYFAIGHVSLDNYIAQISGQSPNHDTNTDCVNYVNFVSTGTGAYGQALGQGCVYPASVKTIGNQLDAKGLTWKAYEEDIANSTTEPKTCRHPPIGAADPTIVATKTDMYATRHDPWVYFHSIIDTPACKTEVVGLNVLTTDLREGVDDPESLVHHAERL